MEHFDPSKLTKLYYNIGEVSSMFGVNSSLIRFWEKEFNVIQLKKNAKGNRVFTPKDILKFHKIYTLVKLQGYTLEGAKKALKSKDLTHSTTESLERTALISKLEGVIERLNKMKNS